MNNGKEKTKPSDVISIWQEYKKMLFQIDSYWKRRRGKILNFETSYAILKSMTSNPRNQILITFDQCFPVFLHWGEKGAAVNV